MKLLIKKSFILLGLGVSSILLNGCAGEEKLKKMVEEHPEIVFAAIEKHPDQFLDVVNKAVREAESRQRQKMADEESKRSEEEFKNPLKPEIDPARAIYGAADAPITIVEYSDFECPFCSRGYTNLKETLKLYPGKIRVVYKHLPLDFHPKAMPAARYFEAVARQGAEKAYKFHDMIFENQKEFVKSGEAYLKTVAKKVGADLKQVEKDLADPKLDDRIKADMAEAAKFGFNGTPGFLINGVSIRGALPTSEFQKIIDRHLGGEKK